jgi:hypothetical protein
MKRLIVFLLLISLAIPVAFSGSKIYVWVDESGNTQFTDYPPPQQDGAVSYREIENKMPSEPKVVDNGVAESPHNAVRPTVPSNTVQNIKQASPGSSQIQEISRYESYKIQLERGACPYLKRGTREWSNCRAEAKKRYGEICRNEKQKLESDLRQAYCALADYMTIIEN